MAGNLTYAQLEGVWLNAAAGTQYATQQWAALMAAIAMAESNGNPNITNPTDSNGQGGTQTSWGLWQISNGDHTEPSPNWNDPVTNAQLALAKLQSSQGLGAWGTYTSGAYQAFINTSTTPDTSGNYAVDTSAAAGAAATTAAQAEANCAWRINFNIPVLGGDVCLLSYSQIRAVVSAGIILAGGLVGLFGIASLMGITGTAAKLGALVAAPEAAPAVAAAAAAAEAKKAEEEAAQERHTQRQYDRNARARANYSRDVERDVVPF